MPAIDELARLIQSGYPTEQVTDTVTEHWRSTIDNIFGERYHKATQYSKRVVLMNGEDNVSFAGLLPKDSPNSGAYGGMSLVWFPSQEGKSLLAYVVGTKGIAPDESILTRPGHARYLRALKKYIAKKYDVFVWCKQDPANITETIPKVIKDKLASFAQVTSRYGSVLYCLVEVPSDTAKALGVVKAFFDWYAYERGWSFNAGAKSEFEHLHSDLQKNLFPNVTEDDIYKLLLERQFVILQGPPGTGKTRLAINLLRKKFKEQGFSVQFHPAVSYENFISGISPSVVTSELSFKVEPGWLLKAINNSKSYTEYLLHIDEVNRADLSKILGEAIYLFEYRDIKTDQKRQVSLVQPVDNQKTIEYPKNLYILGTMNSADRSIAIMDLAVRRRFAFVDIWPDISAIEQQNIQLATDAFKELVHIFTQYASDEAFVYLPGHAYFLAEDETELLHRINYELIPLLKEYIINGRVTSLENELRGYIDWIETITIQHEN